MLLKNLIKTPSNNFKDIKVNGISLDSRSIKRGNLFFAIKGSKVDGKKFINEAIKKGAKVVVCSKDIKINNFKVLTVKVKNPLKALEYACINFYKKKPKNIFAVTGTNGKSSVADFFHQILFLNNINVATIGTLGIKCNNKIKKINLTSPDIITLHKELANIKKKKIDNVIIEASSHGLHQGRLNGINLKGGIFTNFSQDHLDYHINMKNYFKAKMILFTQILKKNKYIITDEEIKEFKAIKTISKKRKLKVRLVKKDYILIRKKVKNLVGSFQFKNLSMAIVAAKLCGLKERKIKKTIKKVTSVNGRLEFVRTLPNRSKVFIDYAHTPDALLNVLQSLKDYYNKNINLVFGCGGERDFKKRILMGDVAQKFCNKIFVTDDNPRNENPKKIRKSIIKGIKSRNFFEIGNRAKAIKTAIKNSEPQEIILVAGKGHEMQQDYGNKKIKFSDKNVIKNIKVTKINYSEKNLNFKINAKIIKKIIPTKKKYEFKGVTINSNQVKKGNLFIAIKGKRKDGNDYFLEALKKGANYCVVSQKIKSKNKKLIKLKNTLKFLNNFASQKRNLSKASIVAVTGSAGKTTVKTLLGNLLKNYGKTYFSPKSFNNHFGVPLSLSNLENEYKFGVFEAGMSNLGEINNLSKLITPDVAVITNVAEAHMENFKNLKGIAKAKGEIINNIKENGTIILNRDDRYFDFFCKLANKRKIKIISFGMSKKSDVYPTNIKNEKFFKISAFNQSIFIKKNNINIMSIICCIAVLKSLNLDLLKVVKTLNALDSLHGRGKIFKVKRFKTKFNLIDESYNANPLSVKNAIINLSKIKKRNSKKYLLLGDMLELGKRSDIYHKDLSKVINNADIDKVFIYGTKIFNTYKYTKKNKKGNILQYKSDFDEIFSKIIKKNDYLMIKGSNSTGLNKLSNRIIKGALNVI